VNNQTDCEHVRLELMAALDDESGPASGDRVSNARRHLATCTGCEQWLRQLESMSRRVDRLPYQDSAVDLWPAIERTLGVAEAKRLNRRWLYVLIGVVVGWRSLQLFVDLPLPLLQLAIPLACGLAALWQLARDPLAIQSFAPELQKRGV